MKVSFSIVGNRFMRLIMTYLCVLVFPPSLTVNEHPSAPVPTADSVSVDRSQDAVSYTDPTSLYISRMPVSLQRANEIYDNTGDIRSVLSRPNPSTSKPLAEQGHSLIPPAFLLIGSAFGLLILLTIVTFAKNLREHRHAACVVTSPESSILR
ncbi:hypothetical protein SAMN04489737_1455 [Arcanobacterium phocae]|uniref:Uncharacterized protein n=1 Tax=Arcanobacterium phocae TaxID=131112 RepID=A0A1H2LJL3_9ACTO|nr:hypothetical protein SAMN04489737_1455 [Arcanobacterium phocae]